MLTQSILKEMEKGTIASNFIKKLLNQIGFKANCDHIMKSKCAYSSKKSLMMFYVTSLYNIQHRLEIFQTGAYLIS